MRQGGAHERLSAVRPLGGRRAEEGTPGRHVAEQLVHLHRRAAGPPLGPDHPHPSAVDLDRRAPVGSLRPGGEHEPGNGPDRRERLAAEAERLDPLEVLGDAQLARGMG